MELIIDNTDYYCIECTKKPRKLMLIQYTNAYLCESCIKKASDLITSTPNNDITQNNPSNSINSSLNVPGSKIKPVVAYQINEMTKYDLIELIVLRNLKYNPTDKNVIEIRKGIINELGLTDIPDFKNMDREQIIEYIETNDIPVDYDNIKSLLELRKVLIA